MFLHAYLFVCVHIHEKLVMYVLPVISSESKKCFLQRLTLPRDEFGLIGSTAFICRT